MHGDSSPNDDFFQFLLIINSPEYHESRSLFLRIPGWSDRGEKGSGEMREEESGEGDRGDSLGESEEGDGRLREGEQVQSAALRHLYARKSAKVADGRSAVKLDSLLVSVCAIRLAVRDENGEWEETGPQERRHPSSFR